jgi:hypothetical protein
MSAFADASFLVAAFASSDVHNPVAWRWWAEIVEDGAKSASDPRKVVDGSAND